MVKLEQIGEIVTQARFVPQLAFTVGVAVIASLMMLGQLAGWEHSAVAHQGVTCTMGERVLSSERISVGAMCKPQAGPAFRAWVREPTMVVSIIEQGITLARCDASHSGHLRNCTPL